MKMKLVLLVLSAFALSFAAQGTPARAQSGSIAAVVNDGAISTADLYARMRLIMVSSGMPDTPEMREKIEPQILNMLIDESLMRQEAARLNITVSEEEVAKGFETLAQQNNFTAEQFHQVLANGKIPANALPDQIRAQIAWSQVLQRKLRPQIEITDAQIEAALNRIRADLGKEEFLIAEIFLPVDAAAGPGQETEIKQLADRLTMELRKGQVPFSALATQFSQSASASKGGDMGWMQAGQLPEAVDQAIATMKEGELSPPIRSLTGYHIVLIRKKRTITEETLPDHDAMLQKLGMEQLDRMQRRYLLDLKSSAFIERRV